MSGEVSAQMDTTSTATGRGRQMVRRLRWHRNATFVAAVCARVPAIDAVNTATLFAAMLLISVFPVFIVLAGVTNRNFADHFAERLGLDRRASTDIQQLFGASMTSSTALDVLGWLIWSAALWGCRLSANHLRVCVRT